MTKLKPNEKIARKILSLVDHGLVAGIGRPAPGKMCVEAAVNYAFGRDHGDEPPCVGTAVRIFKIDLNDCYWSSDLARGHGMRRLAIAQLGSDSLDQEQFKKLIAFRGLKTIVPFYIRKYREKYSDTLKSYELAKLEELSVRFENMMDESAAKNIIKENRGLGVGVGVGFGFGLGVGLGFGLGLGVGVGLGLGVGFGFGFGLGVGLGFGFGFGFGLEAFKEFMGDEFLIQIARLGESILVEMKSPGCQWLPLCDLK